MQLLKINTNIIGEPKTTILQVCTSFLQVWTCILYLCLGLRAWLRFGIPTENWKREWRVGSPETRRPASTLLAQAPTCGPLSHVYGSQSEKQLLRSRLRELLERQVFTPPSLCFHCEKTLGIPFLVEKKRRIPPARLF